jgi:threonyl-tRNA synthetase
VELGTIQVDYNLPQRFKLEYTAEDNSKQTPVMVHRAPFGSLERFTAVLIEHTAGHFPLWLTPDQVAILPISDKYNDYALEVKKYFDGQEVRAYIDDRNEKIGRKIRDNELKRVPYMVVVGEKESAEGLVSMRKQGGGEQATMSMADFAQRIKDEVADQLKEIDG